MSETNWIPGLVVAGVGTLAGIVLALRHRAPAAELDPRTKVERQRDLQARKEELLALVRELDDTRDTRPPEAYAAERARLMQEAAETLRKLETVDSPAPQAPHRERIRDRNPQVVGAAWGAGVMAFVGLTAFGLYSYSQPRGEGQSITGGGGGMGPPAASAPASAARTAPRAPDPEITALEATVKAEPTNLEAKNKLAHARLGQNELMEAFKLAEEVVKVDPENAEARTHQGVVLMSIGDLDMAGQVLDRVLTKTPTQPEALGYRGAVHWQRGEVDQAIAVWERAKAAVPAEAATLDKLIQMAKMGPPAEVAKADAPSAPAEAAGPAELSGTITLAEGLPATGTLYIYVRPAGVDAGPPARVKRLPATFPATFSISAADSPMGGVLSGQVQISARLDPDGNAMTKEPDAPAARSAPLEVGATGINLTLTRP